MSAAGWTEAFLEMMAVERSAARNTLTAYAKDLEDASGFLAGQGRDLSSASLEDVEAYFGDLSARGLSPSTAARRRAAAAAISRSTSSRESTLGSGLPFFGASTRREGSSWRQPSPSTKR